MSAELSESLLNGRFQLLERPTVLPGSCAVCGSVERPVVDFQATVEWYGAILICTDCILAAAHLVSAANSVAAQDSDNSVLIFADVEAINEYVRRASDSVNRLSILLDHIGFDDKVKREETSTDDKFDDGADEKPAEPVLEDVGFLSIEGPSGLSADSSDESGILSL